MLVKRIVIELDEPVQLDEDMVFIDLGYLRNGQHEDMICLGSYNDEIVYGKGTINLQE